MANGGFDPEFERIARFLPRNLGKRPRLLRMSPKVVGLLDRLRRRDDLSVVEVGGITARVHTPPNPSDQPAPAVLWIHGGGFIGGYAALEDTTCRLLASELNALVVAVDYRLAPEHPFPAALEDCHDALLWLAARDDVDPGRVVVAGASAGGGLAAQLTLLARERGEVTPVFQALVYPMLDDRTAVRDDVDEEHMRIWGVESNRVGWSAYLGREPGGDSTPPLAAPVRHDDLTGLPAAWIGVGTLDLFLIEDRAYAERLRDAGVRCELIEIEGVFHGFDRIRPKADATLRMRASMIAAMRTAIDRS